MPELVKKFNLTYKQVPDVFSLPKSLYLSEEAELIPEEYLEQTETQKAYINQAIKQLHIDLPRTNYLDFEFSTTSQLKRMWLSPGLSDCISLAKGVYPNYTQGNISSASISEILFTKQFILPLNDVDSESFEEICKTIKRICFAYKNSLGQPAGFSLVAAEGNGKGVNPGWIISTIQNATANPKERAVTVLASANYITTPAQKIVPMDNPQNIEAELKAAINNDKVAELIKGMFNQDGSMNHVYITELYTRITVNHNLDHRERKEPQLTALFQLADALDETSLNEHVRLTKEQIANDIHFFQQGTYEAYLEALVNKLALALRPNPGQNTARLEIAALLKKISAHCASIELLAEEAYLNTELANTYRALAKHVIAEMTLLRFDKSAEDNARITQLSLLEIDTVQQKVERFYEANPEVSRYFNHKNQRDIELQARLAALPKPKVSSFFSRNKPAIEDDLILGLFIGVIVGLGLTGLFSPIAVILIAVSTAVLVSSTTCAIDIYNEQRNNSEISNYSSELSQMRAVHQNVSLTEEQNLQQGIDPASFLIPEKPDFLSKIIVTKDKPLTPERVAHELWLQDRSPKATAVSINRFALWSTKQPDLNFGINEVEDVLNRTYVMSSS